MVLTLVYLIALRTLLFSLFVMLFIVVSLFLFMCKNIFFDYFFCERKMNSEYYSSVLRFCQFDLDTYHPSKHVSLDTQLIYT